jgi:hypothetical protein
LPISKTAIKCRSLQDCKSAPNWPKTINNKRKSTRWGPSYVEFIGFKKHIEGPLLYAFNFLNKYFLFLFSEKGRQSWNCRHVYISARVIYISHFADADDDVSTRMAWWVKLREAEKGFWAYCVALKKITTAFLEHTVSMRNLCFLRIKRPKLSITLHVDEYERSIYDHNT